jgi:hypothetical protein
VLVLAEGAKLLAAQTTAHDKVTGRHASQVFDHAGEVDVQSVVEVVEKVEEPVSIDLEERVTGVANRARMYTSNNKRSNC